MMAMRSLQKGEAAAVGLRAEFPNARTEALQLDMESFCSVQVFTGRCEQEIDRLHVAVLTAALGKLEVEPTGKDRYRETTTQVNYVQLVLTLE